MSRREIPEIRRRELMTLLGTGAVFSLAGCGGDGGDGAADGEDGATDGGDGDGGDEATPTESPEPDDGEELQAVEVPEDANCPVCDMKSANFPEWNAQAVHEDDTREFFCTSGCATTYYVEPARFAETDAAVAGLWVTGFESSEFIDGMEAYYALETDSDRVDDPMRLNPAPFADREDAVAYVDEVDYLTSDDIVELSAFDRELATQYRARFLEDESDTGEEYQAVEVPEDANCPVCDMKSANFPEWNAQAVHEDDTREFFCTSGCATTYYVEPARFAETDAAIGGLWVTGFESGEFIDGMEAYYALETDSDRVDDPMRLNPAPFANRDDAVAYVDEVEYLSTDDIVELSAFDRELATQYRARFLEE